MWRSYIRFVLVKSIKNAWLTVIARDVPDLIGKFLLGGLVLGLLYWASGSPEGYLAFSSELNTALTILKAGLVGAAIIFVFNMLFVAPYQLWKDAEEKRSLLENPNKEFGDAFAERSAQFFPNEVIHRFENDPIGDALKSMTLRSDSRRAEFRQERRLKQIESDKHRRAMIGACRDMVHRYRTTQMPEPFEAFLRGERALLDIQPHLGNEYWKGVLGRAELKGVQDETPRRDLEAAMFLRELARLEKEWKL